MKPSAFASDAAVRYGRTVDDDGLEVIGTEPMLGGNGAAAAAYLVVAVLGFCVGLIVGLLVGWAS